MFYNGFIMFFELPTIPPDCPQIAQMAPGWPPDGPQMAPRWFPDGQHGAPRWSQEPSRWHSWGLCIHVASWWVSRACPKTRIVCVYTLDFTYYHLEQQDWIHKVVNAHCQVDLQPSWCRMMLSHLSIYKSVMYMYLTAVFSVCCSLIATKTLPVKIV